MYEAAVYVTQLIFQRRTKTSMVAAREKTAIAFDSWKCKHYFEVIWSKSKNTEVMCKKQDVVTLKISALNLISTQYSAQWRSINYCAYNYMNNMGCAKVNSAVYEIVL